MRFPYVYEINTWPWLQALGADLGTVPPEAWDAVCAPGVDAVWLMGVWERSPAGIDIALRDDELRASFEAALPGHRDEDVVGSPYCIRGYVVDEHLGGAKGLAAARAELRARGVGLLLDFVPNHVAPDHPWTTEHPDWFVHVDGRIANGRDPYFPPWPDVVQLDATSPELRAAVVETLRDIADQCDGVRCDMAMLVMNEVFARTWGVEPPPDDYWPTVIPAVHETHPGFLFVGEAYWDMEHALQLQGFDHCYDKRLYDRLLHEPASEVRAHLQADDAYQAGLVRFLENHDEPRAAAAVDDQARAEVLAVATLTQPGARLVHHGQDEGRRVRLPVFLGRFPDEPVDERVAAFYARLWPVLADPTFRGGRWQLCETAGDESLLAWCWDGASRWLVVVNLGAENALGSVRTPWPDLIDEVCTLVDDTNGTTFERTGDDLVGGLFVALGPHRWHLFRVTT